MLLVDCRLGFCEEATQCFLDNFPGGDADESIGSYCASWIARCSNPRYVQNFLDVRHVRSRKQKKVTALTFQMKRLLLLSSRSLLTTPV